MKSSKCSLVVIPLIAIAIALGIASVTIMSPNELMDRWTGTHIYSPKELGMSMSEWFERHKFMYRIPARPVTDDLVRHPENYVLPTGQLWPDTPVWWDFSVPYRWTWELMTWWIKTTPRMVQDYTPYMYWYRVLQAGLHHSRGGVDPHTWPKLTALIKEADASGVCQDSVARRLDLVYNLLHSGEERRTLVDTVDWLCDETCVTPLSCTHRNSTTAYDRLIRELRSIIYLRLGELENCRERHTHESCILPLQGSALHVHKEGSTRAIDALMLQLEFDPTHLGAQWLLNIAHMTLGSWPHAVDPRYVVPPSAFESEADIGRFVNVAGGLGVDSFSALGAAIMDDFNGDGLLDVWHTGSTYDDQMTLLINPGVSGKFVDQHARMNLTGVNGGCNAKHSDFNNDGIVDVMILRGGWVNVKQPNTLLRGNPDGTFTEVTLKAFDRTTLHASHNAEWADYDRDGLLDLFIANELNNCELWHNLGNEVFESVGEISGVNECGLTKAAQFADINNDGYPDIYVSRYGQPNRLWLNNGRPHPSGHGWSFTDIAASAGVQEPILSFACLIFDANQDGLLDILAAGHLFEGPEVWGSIFTGKTYWARDNIITPTWGGPHQRLSRLYINNGDLTFTDVSEGAGLRRVVMVMAMNYGDLDNDGYPDVFFGTGQPDVRSLGPNKMFRNSGGKYFQDITTSGGFGHLQKGHGISFGDINNDGNLDVIANFGGAWLSDYFHDAVFLNPGNHGNHWLKVKLVGTHSSRLPYGARINATVELEDGSVISRYGLYGIGASYGANSIMNGFHLGLGKATVIKTLDITWPRSNTVQTFTNVPMDAQVILTEGVPDVQVGHLKSVTYNVEELIGDQTCHHHNKNNVPDVMPVDVKKVEKHDIPAFGGGGGSCH